MTRTRGRNFLIILILGALSTVSPFSIDMYLPAFPQIARDLGTTPAEISLSVSGYFIGLALGQLCYGPLLDRFGRKRPLYAGMTLFILASLGCIAARSPGLFIALRLLQAIGGCVAGVGAVAMVRDFFPARESAKILSLLILVLSVSPLFAPSIGSLVATTAGWQWIFVILAGFAVLMIAVTATLLPEGHKPDPSISLRPTAIVRGFLGVIENPQFATYAIGGAFSFAGLFVYVTGSPIIFIQGFHLGPHAYGLVFAALACSFIGGSQLNVWLSRRHQDRKIFRAALICQNVVVLIILIGTVLGWYGLAANIALLMLYLPFCGIAYPNAAAIALAPFSKNIGSAAAALGFLQMSIGALASTGVGLLHSSSSLPIFAVMAATAAIGLGILLLSGKLASAGTALADTSH
ncbi:MAG TPA: multidrug effflux MFS transporter [Xanthobacteraceae bacterium]|nr:multidrug effflux MFS transporter [Xanthobacteraceae bacterium]